MTGTFTFKTRCTLAAVGLLLALALLLAIRCGAATMEALTLADPVLRLRAPRVLLAALVGAALGMSGAASQALLRNPLAEPGTLGIGIASATGAAMALLVLPAAMGSSVLLHSFGVATGAFALAMVAAVVVVGAAKLASSELAPIFAGLAVSALGNAALGAITTLANDAQLRSLTFWSMGSLGAASFQVTSATALLILPGLLLLYAQAASLNGLLLGEAVAASMGIDVPSTRRRVILCCSLLTAAAIAPCGFVAFVGLLAPHATRLLVGSDQRVVLLVSALLGASVVVLADAVARTALAPVEIPVGIVTSCIGAPLFASRIFRLLRSAA